MKNKSILGNMLFDNFVFWGLAFISIFLLRFISGNNMILTLFLFVCLYLFDSGHVYLTYIRVVKEFKHAKLFFIVTPILVFLFLYYVATYDYTLFFYVIGYATLFHFIRQIYGINRWYLSISGEKITQLRDNIIYLVTIIPTLILFFRQPINTADFGYQFFFLQTSCNECIIKALNVLFVVSVIAFLIQEYLFFKEKQPINLNRILFVIGTGIVFLWIGNFAKTPLEIVVPLVIIHGFTYYAVTIKFEREFYKFTFKKALFIVLGVGLLFGVLINYLYDIDYMYQDSILLALLFSPLLTHYVVDMKIWLNSYIKKIKG